MSESTEIDRTRLEAALRRLLPELGEGGRKIFDIVDLYFTNPEKVDAQVASEALGILDNIPLEKFDDEAIGYFHVILYNSTLKMPPLKQLEAVATVLQDVMKNEEQYDNDDAVLAQADELHEVVKTTSNTAGE
ncbi:hypothetical protein VTJ49DRAFT_4950 [Mycothermus thermophilus]|uniref:Uncharacterized protein n=1 Tax=Humicola insolens TaxID=85995 RepID=A0ABR3VRJ8_HUMIN